MEITKGDLKELKNELLEAVKTTVQDEVKVARDLLVQEIRASESRTKQELRQELRGDIQASERRVIGAVTDFVGAA